MTRRRRLAPWLVLAVVAVAVAGCHGSGASKPSSTAPSATSPSGDAVIPGLSASTLQRQARAAVPDGAETTTELKGAPVVRLISKADVSIEIDVGRTGADGVSFVLCSSGKATGSAGRLKILRLCVDLPIAGLDHSGAQAWLDRITIKPGSKSARSSFTGSGLQWTSYTVNGSALVNVGPVTAGSGAGSATASPTL